MPAKYFRNPPLPKCWTHENTICPSMRQCEGIVYQNEFLECCSCYANCVLGTTVHMGFLISDTRFTFKKMSEMEIHVHGINLSVHFCCQGVGSRCFQRFNTLWDRGFLLEKIYGSIPVPIAPRSQLLKRGFITFLVMSSRRCGRWSLSWFTKKKKKNRRRRVVGGQCLSRLLRPFGRE